MALRCRLGPWLGERPMIQVVDSCVQSPGYGLPRGQVTQTQPMRVCPGTLGAAWGVPEPPRGDPAVCTSLLEHLREPTPLDACCSQALPRPPSPPKNPGGRGSPGRNPSPGSADTEAEQEGARESTSGKSRQAWSNPVPAPWWPWGAAGGHTPEHLT